jgi:hypothetical protein
MFLKLIFLDIKLAFSSRRFSCQIFIRIFYFLRVHYNFLTILIGRMTTTSLSLPTLKEIKDVFPTNHT